MATLLATDTVYPVPTKLIVEAVPTTTGVSPSVEPYPMIRVPAPPAAPPPPPPPEDAIVTIPVGPPVSVIFEPATI